MLDVSCINTAILSIANVSKRVARIAIFLFLSWTSKATVRVNGLGSLALHPCGGRATEKRRTRIARVSRYNFNRPDEKDRLRRIRFFLSLFRVIREARSLTALIDKPGGLDIRVRLF